MIPAWFLLAVGFATLGHASEPESVDYSLDWTVAKDGAVTQEYEIRYRGERTLARLQAFSKSYESELRFVENLLTEVGTGFEKTSESKVGAGHFRFSFRGKRPDLKDGLPSLMFWVCLLYTSDAADE